MHIYTVCTNNAKYNINTVKFIHNYEVGTKGLGSVRDIVKKNTIHAGVVTKTRSRDGTEENSSWSSINSSVCRVRMHNMYVCMYGHTYSKSMDQPGKVANPARYQLFLFSFFFNLIYSRWTSLLPSCLWSQRIFPSLPGSRLTIFYRDASSALLDLQLVNQWLNFQLNKENYYFPVRVRA